MSLYKTPAAAAAAQNKRPPHVSEMSLLLSQISMNARKRSSVALWIGCVRTDQVDMNVYARRGYAWTMMANAFVSIHINKSNYGKARHSMTVCCWNFGFVVVKNKKAPGHWKSAARSASASRRAASWRFTNLESIPRNVGVVRLHVNSGYCFLKSSGPYSSLIPKSRQ